MRFASILFRFLVMVAMPIVVAGCDRARSSKSPDKSAFDVASKETTTLPPHRIIDVTVNPDGTYSVEGKKMPLESLGGLLKAKAEASPRGEDGLPTIEVRILAYSDCEYKWLQAVMVECMRAYIWKISFGAIAEDGVERGPGDGGGTRIEDGDLLLHR